MFPTPDDPSSPAFWTPKVLWTKAIIPQKEAIINIPIKAFIIPFFALSFFLSSVVKVYWIIVQIKNITAIVIKVGAIILIILVNLKRTESMVESEPTGGAAKTNEGKKLEAPNKIIFFIF